MIGKEKEALTLNCRLNHGDGRYYPGNEIIFVIEIENNSPLPARNIMYHQTMPDIINGLEENGFRVSAKDGRVIQQKGAVIVVFDEIKGNERARVVVTGRIGGKR